VAKILVEKVAQIFRATADCSENYSIDDVWFSAWTNNKIIGVPCECKTLKGGYQFKYDEEWNTYFTDDIYHKLKFHSEPPESGAPIYFINATDAYGDYEKGKYNKLIVSGAGLTFLAPDSIIFYTNHMLKDAFCGYADYYVRHRTEYGNNNKRLWETKALIRLDKGLYIPCSPPIEMFEK
jgi:hypothetical protein